MARIALRPLTVWTGAWWSPGDQGSYRAWINQFAAGIGRARTAVILQPDLPFALCAPSPAPLQLVAAAARRLNALPHTTVYINVGAAGWASVPQAPSLLERAGIRHARGFALNVTQYGSTGPELHPINRRIVLTLRSRIVVRMEMVARACSLHIRGLPAGARMAPPVSPGSVHGAVDQVQNA